MFALHPWKACGSGGQTIERNHNLVCPSAGIKDSGRRKRGLGTSLASPPFTMKVEGKLALFLNIISNYMLPLCHTKYHDGMRGKDSSKNAAIILELNSIRQASKLALMAHPLQ